MITCICGDPRNGKGLIAMEFMEQAWLLGRPIITNIRLRPGCPFFDDALMLDDETWPVWDRAKKQGFWASLKQANLSGALIVIDEADIFFDAEDYREFGRELRAFFKHHGKYGLDIVLIVQNLNNLYVRLRRMVGVVWVAEWTWKTAPGLQLLGKLIGSRLAIRFSSFRRWQFQDVSLRKPVAVYKMSYTYVARKFFRPGQSWYDTEQMVGVW